MWCYFFVSGQQTSITTTSGRVDVAYDVQQWAPRIPSPRTHGHSPCTYRPQNWWVFFSLFVLWLFFLQRRRVICVEEIGKKRICAKVTPLSALTSHTEPSCAIGDSARPNISVVAQDLWKDAVAVSVRNLKKRFRVCCADMKNRTLHSSGLRKQSERARLGTGPHFSQLKEDKHSVRPFSCLQLRPNLPQKSGNLSATFTSC